MAIETVDQLLKAMANNNSRMIVDKGNLGGFVAGNIISMWRATGTPGQGAIPTTTALCDNTTVGGMAYTAQTAPVKTYLAWLSLSGSNPTVMVEIRDRIAHMGGLNGTLLTAQSVALDLSTTIPAAGRLGSDTDYSDIQFYLEWYTATGATAANATVNVTYNNGTTGNLAVIVLAASRPAGLMIPLVSATAGLYIRGVNNVTLSVSTATAGNFGVTATRIRTSVSMMVANVTETYDWAKLGFPDLENTSCLMFTVTNNNTNTGTLRGSIKLAHG